MLTGASGRGAVGTSAGVGGVGASGWLWLAPFGCARVRCIRVVARFCMPAAMRCLHQPLVALGKSLHSQVPLTTKYCVVPLLWLATLALPSASSSTSPASTILTALSTRPAQSGRVCFALAAISATAARPACRVLVSNPGALASSHVISLSATIVVTFPFDGDG